MASLNLKNNLLSNFSFMFIGNTVYAFSQWIMIMMLAKLSSTEILGQVTLAYAITGPIAVTLDFQLRNIIATDAQNSYYYSNYLNFRFWTCSIFLIFLLFLLLFLDYPFQLSMVILLIGLAKIIELFYEFSYGLFQKEGLFHLIAYSLLLRGSVYVLVLGCTLWITKSIVISILTYVAVLFFGYILGDFHKVLRIEKLRINLQFSQIKKLLKLSFPLGVVMGLISLNANIPKYILTESWGVSEQGYFSALFYFLIAGNMITGALGQIISPMLANFHKEHNYSKFIKYLSMLVFVGVGIGLVLFSFNLFFGESLLNLFYHHEIAQYKMALSILMLSGIFFYSSTFLGIGLTALRQFSIQPQITGVLLIINFVISMLIIPRYGVIGAALSTLIVYGCQFFLLTFVVVRIFKKLGNKGDYHDKADCPFC